MRLLVVLLALASGVASAQPADQETAMTPQTIFNIITIIAIIVGPIAAVWFTRYLDDKRFRDDRRMDVFRTLMRTRRVTLSPDHVGALNLVEIEFRPDTQVIAAWKEYFGDLATRRPPGLKDTDLQEMDSKRSGRLTKLLHAMAKALKFDMDQLEIFEGGYVPQGWQDDEQIQRMIRYGLLEVLSGRRAFPVTPVTHPTTQAAPPNPYPPPPPQKVADAQSQEGNL